MNRRNTDGQDGTPSDLPAILPIDDIGLESMAIGEVARGILLRLALTDPVRAIGAVNGVSALFRQRFHGKGQMSPHVVLADPEGGDVPDNQIRFYAHWFRPEVTVQIGRDPYWDLRETHAYVTDEGMPDAMWHALVAKLPHAERLGDIMDLAFTSGAPTRPLTIKKQGSRDTVQSGPGFVTRTIRQIMFEWDPRFVEWTRTHAALSRIIARSLREKGISP
ncbi:hypothetical protein [uncultured Salinicola sp.]|uniref:hypothetical protein n=1 Tax=uncultured Salinicola sp. TaxID=1193542 RepID=UPI0026094483|nr:hypothetical protein [uncultured Salinicola sp.]|tara:strand:- start:1254 stop:1913 length:660 start_codon:yes stop_codon:yes gene_type:complete